MKTRLSALIALAFLLLASPSYGGQVALMGPQQYLRTTGQPDVFTAAFLAVPGAGRLLIVNGDPDGKPRVAALISVNGTPVATQTDFELPYTSKTVPVTLVRDNSISIQLFGKPGGFLTVTVAEDISCVPLDQCHKAGSWDRTLGQCTNPVATDGTACSDGNACTLTDTCQSGVCVGSNPVVCAALDQCHLPGVCDPSSGVCSNPPKPDGSACNDGDVCTSGDVCLAGACTGTVLACVAPDVCHSATCDAATGCVLADLRTAIDVSPDLRRFTLTDPAGRVNLYTGADCSAPWQGRYSQSNESPHENYCGPTAGMNLLYWYGAPSTYAQLGSDMNTNNWMSPLDAVLNCACFCTPCACVWDVCLPILPPEPTCLSVCSAVAQHWLNAGTLAKDMMSALSRHSPAGYRPYLFSGNRSLAEFENALRAGDPIAVLLWYDDGSNLGFGTLHWTVVIGTDDVNGTTWVRFANANSLSWDAFVQRWAFSGMDSYERKLLDDKADFVPFTGMRYQATTELRANQTIDRGQDNAIVSADGRFILILDDVGNLVLYPAPIVLGTQYWRSGTTGLGGQVAVMQADGNFVIYGPNGAVWSTHTNGHPGAYLALQNDGNVVIYDSDNVTALWSTHTCCH